MNAYLKVSLVNGECGGVDDDDLEESTDAEDESSLNVASSRGRELFVFPCA